MNASPNIQYLYDDVSKLVVDIGLYRHGIFNIKPKILFKLLEERNQIPKDMIIHMPPSGIGSVTLLDSSVIISLVHLVKPKRMFEFGTFLGYSTSLLARNSSDDSHVYSIDLGYHNIDSSTGGEYIDSEILTDKSSNDNYLRFVQSQDQVPYIMSLEDRFKTKISLLYGDSKTLSVADQQLTGNIDLVFIDGGHDLDTILIDTENAVKMIGNKGVIIWHDFNSRIHDDVTVYLHDIAKHNPIIAVDNSLVAFMMVGESLSDFVQGANGD